MNAQLGKMTVKLSFSSAKLGINEERTCEFQCLTDRDQSGFIIHPHARGKEYFNVGNRWVQVELWQEGGSLRFDARYESSEDGTDIGDQVEMKIS